MPVSPFALFEHNLEPSDGPLLDNKLHDLSFWNTENM